VVAPPHLLGVVPAEAMQHAVPRVPLHLIPGTPEEAREQLARLLRARPGIEEDLGCRPGCSDRQLIESLLKHDSPFALLRSLGFDSSAASNASCLLKESKLTPRVRDLARNIEVKLSPVQRPLPTRGTPVRRKSDMADVPESTFDWRREVLDVTPAPLGERDAPTPSRASRFGLGQAVRVAFTEDGPRLAGVVTCVEPLQVQPQGISESFEFVHVEAVEGDAGPVGQAEAGGGADECGLGAPALDSDLLALDLARLCLQQGMPQLAKVYMEQISVIDVKAGALPTPMMASIVEGDEEGTAEKAAGLTHAPAQGLAQVGSPAPQFEPIALDTPAGLADHGGVVRAAPGAGLLEPRFAVGQRVMFADNEAGEWNAGVVTCTGPLLVRPDGYEESFDFGLVEPLDSAQLGGGATERAGVQDVSSRSCGGGRAESPNASDNPHTSNCSGASSNGMPPWHGLGTTLNTCTSRVPGFPAALSLQNASAVDRTVLSSPKAGAMIKGASWLPCCVAR